MSVYRNRNVEVNKLAAQIAELNGLAHFIFILKQYRLTLYRLSPYVLRYFSGVRADTISVHNEVELIGDSNYCIRAFDRIVMKAQCASP